MTREILVCAILKLFLKEHISFSSVSLEKEIRVWQNTARKGNTEIFMAFVIF